MALSRRVRVAGRRNALVLAVLLVLGFGVYTVYGYFTTPATREVADNRLGLGVSPPAAPTAQQQEEKQVISGGSSWFSEEIPPLPIAGPRRRPLAGPRSLPSVADLPWSSLVAKAAEPLPSGSTSEPATTEVAQAPSTHTAAGSTTPPAARKKGRATTSVAAKPKGAQSASGYFPLVYGLDLDSPRAGKRLAELIRASLEVDPSGHRRLQEEECIEHGACATPAIYLAEINRFHKESGVTSLGELEGFFRRLECRLGAKGILVEMDRLTKTEKVADKDNVRPYHDGEYACYDPKTGESIFAVSCGNVGKERRPRPSALIEPAPRCREVQVVLAEPGDLIFFAGFSDESVPAGCLAVWNESTQRWDEREPVPCTVNCGWLQMFQGALPPNYRNVYTGSWVAQSREVRIRVPFMYLGLCDRRGDRYSLGWLVEPKHWVDESGTRIKDVVVVKGAYGYPWPTWDPAARQRQRELRTSGN